MPSALTSARCVFRSKNYLNGIRSNMTTRTATTTSPRLRPTAASSQQTEGTGITRGGVALEGLRWNNKFAVRRRGRLVVGRETNQQQVARYSLARCSFIIHHSSFIILHSRILFSQSLTNPFNISSFS